MIFLLNFVPALILAIYFIARRRLDAFEPVLIALSYVALNIALSGLSLWADSNSFSAADSLKSIGVSTMSYLTAAALEISVFLAFLLGYSLRPMNLQFVVGERQSTPISFDQGLALPLLLVSTLAALGAMGVYNLIGTFNIDTTSILSISKKRFIDAGEGEISGAAGYIRWLAQFSQYAALLFLTVLYSRQRRLTAVQTGFGVLLVALMLLPPFLTSSRFALLSSLLSVLAVLHYMRKPIGLRTLTIMGALAIVFVSLLGELRQYQPGEQVDVSARGVLESIGGRENAGYSLTARVVEEMPQAWEYQYGRTFTAWIFAPVPRSIWPDKPTVSLGQDVKVKLFGRPVAGGGGVPPSSAGEMYINFGLFALFLAPVYSLLGGAITRSVYWKLIRQDRTPYSIFVYALLFMTVLPTFFWTQFSKGIVDLIKVVVVLFLLRQVLRLRGIRRPTLGVQSLPRQDNGP